MQLWRNSLLCVIHACLRLTVFSWQDTPTSCYNPPLPAEGTRQFLHFLRCVFQLCESSAKNCLIFLSPDRKLASSNLRMFVRGCCCHQKAEEESDEQYFCGKLICFYTNYISVILYITMTTSGCHLIKRVDKEYWWLVKCFPLLDKQMCFTQLKLHYCGYHTCCAALKTHTH